MRTDYFNPGPPWKLVFEDKIGFRYTVIIRDKAPPEFFTFPIIRASADLMVNKRKFKLIGILGNTAAYKEIT